MIQKVKIKSDKSDPFSDNYIEMDLPKGQKIISNEPYVQETYEMYAKSWGDGYLIDKRKSDQIVNAKVSKIGEDQIEMNINAKFPAYITKNKEDKEIINSLSVGDEIKIRLKSKTEDSPFEASIGDVIKENKMAEIIDNIDEPIAFRAVVKELIHGGYMLNLDGIEVFMPGSLAGMNVLWDFESLIGQEIVVMPISLSKEKGTIVVSRRKYYESILPAKVDELRESMDEERIGYVTGSKPFGVFVEFDECVTGMIPVGDLNDEWKEKHSKNKINPGDEINFWANQIIHDKKIMLTQVRNEAWDDIENKYPPLSSVEGTIVKIRNYGLFIELEENVVGMMHSSEFGDKEKFKEGDKIKVKIDSIDTVNKRVVLKR
jgi:ribosomal protein S1